MTYKDKTKAYENRRARYLKHKAHIQAHAQKPEVKARRQALKKIYFQENKEYFREYALKKKYGISYDEYKKIIDKNKGCCPICVVVLTFGSANKDAAVVDHNHDTGAVRGVICNKCNRGIGLMSSKENLIRAIKYLDENDTAF